MCCASPAGYNESPPWMSSHAPQNLKLIKGGPSRLWCVEDENMFSKNHNRVEMMNWAEYTRTRLKVGATANNLYFIQNGGWSLTENPHLNI